MGRHKRIKKIDPFYQGKGRESTTDASKKSATSKGKPRPRLRKHEQKDDLRPKNINEQEKMSQRFKLFAESIKEAKKHKLSEGKKKQRNKYKVSTPNQKLKPEDRGESGMEEITFTPKSWESEERFIRRMDKETYEVFDGVKMVEKLEQGMETVPELQESTKDKRDKKKERLVRKKEKVKAKKMKKVHDALEKEVYIDRVKFGEVVMEPPNIRAKPRKASGITKPRQKMLLLNKILEKSSKPVVKTQKKTSNRTKASKKRKHMSVAEKRIFDKSQASAIQAYRDVKKAKRTQNT
ncbi:coiled-coil domain-containing protein 137-like [Saccoglossus kowalevskii]|uniref:Coiled-coil domain-containing protein 137-like n=1 Tax=Saccoglossus kowalevskii TaxID=10224 RepID=A0ABM0M3Z5_SACKO|nr:PREDICTED: coiled-coil domain-containing protein 137-like [Saccoglossus kowalevskii]